MRPAVGVVVCADISGVLSYAVVISRTRPAPPPRRVPTMAAAAARARARAPHLRPSARCTVPPGSATPVHRPAPPTSLGTRLDPPVV